MSCPLLRKPIEMLEVHSISPSNHPGTKKDLNVNLVLTDAASHQTPRAIAGCALTKKGDWWEPMQIRAMLAGITILCLLTA